MNKQKQRKKSLKKALIRDKESRGKYVENRISRFDEW